MTRFHSLFVGSVLIFCCNNSLGVVASDAVNRTIQDPKTKIVYYLESDQRHLAAIAPNGKLLWCTQVMSPQSSNGLDKFESFRFWKLGDLSHIQGKGEDCIVLFCFEGANMQIVINKQSGKIVGGEGM